MRKQVRFSDQIRRAIDSSGMSRYFICKRIGLDQAVMSRFMARKGGLSIETLDKLGGLLKLHIPTEKRK